MKKLLLVILILATMNIQANETWLCLMQTSYEGFDGTIMKQEAIFDLAKSPKPKIWQWKAKWITNLNSGKVVESSYRKDLLKNEQISLIHGNITEDINSDVKRLRTLVFQRTKNGKLKYPCPYWIKAMYDRK